MQPTTWTAPRFEELDLGSDIGADVEAEVAPPLATSGRTLEASSNASRSFARRAPVVTQHVAATHEVAGAARAGSLRVVTARRPLALARRMSRTRPAPRGMACG